MNNKEAIQNISKTTGLISLGFIVIISLLMILNFIQVNNIDPLESYTIDKLVEKLDQNPADQELKEQIRAVELLSRKAYFSSIRQLKTGAYLLLGSIILLLISIKVHDHYNSLKYGLEDIKKRSYWKEMFKERRAITISTGILAVVALLISFTANQYYTDFNSQNLTELIKDTLIEDQEQESYFENFNDPDTIKEEVQDTVQISDEDSSKVIIDKTDFPSSASIKRYHPGFRGPFGLGVSYKTNIPVDWDGATGKNIIWKKATGLPGLNSPVIWGNYLFIAGANAKSQKVYCYNRLTGALIWAKDVKNIPGHPAKSPKVTNDTGYSASSLSTDGKRVYAIFATGDIICFNFKGEQLWAKNLGVPDNHYGHSSSLISYKDKLIVQYDHNKSQNIIALSIYTGEEIWNIERDGRISWSSPIIITKGTGAEIIVNNEPYVAAYNIDTGKEIWKTDCLSGEIGPSPAYENGMVFACNEYAKLVGIRNGSIVWEHYDYLSDTSSPVAYNGLLFITTSYGDMACLSQSDGSVKWSHEFENGCYGSPVIAEGKLYVTDRTGITRIVEASDKFKIIGEPKLGEKSDCTPAFADGRIYIRGKNNLYCIGIE